MNLSLLWCRRAMAAMLLKNKMNLISANMKRDRKQLSLVITILILSAILFNFFYKRQTAYAATTTFITRSGNQLLLNGIRFRFSGTNIHWLGLDDPNGGTVPSHFRIDDALD